MPDTPTAPSSSTSTPSPVPSSPTNTLKRKERPEESEEKPSIETAPVPSGAHPRPDEYETGRVTCETCGASVSFRDEQTGGFTVNHWEAHKQTCSGSSSNPPPGDPVIYTPESTAEALSHPPAKRRRAKRTEEERIQYLRADPYVGQFEAYRVLCASCDKWIRLRPNSTYCSIPWDAHRKSCLAKKINNKNVYALEERNTLFSKDPDVRKFDPERILCNTCDKWISVPPDDHLQAVQQWLQHRASCQRNSGSATISPRRPEQPPSGGIASASQAAPAAAHSHPSASNPTSPNGQAPSSASASTHGPPAPPSLSAAGRYPSSSNGSPSFHDLTPSNYAPAHESRRRNAEQRAATLRADRLIGEVEPNRVFCSLCQKWVQLRQDSSYCAYPWLQHRGKCLARHQRRAQKAAEIADMKARKMQHGGGGAGPVPLQEEDELASDHEGPGGGADRTRASSSLDAESEEGIDRDATAAEDGRARKEASRRPSLNEGHFRNASSASSRYAQHPNYHHHPHHPHPQQQQQQHHHSKSRSIPYGGSTTHNNSANGRYSGGSMSHAVSSYRNDRDRDLHSRGSHAHAHHHNHHHAHGHSIASSQAHPHRGHTRPASSWDEDADAEGEPDPDGEYFDDDAHGHRQSPPSPASASARPMSTAAAARGGGVPRRPWPVGLADLDSPSGRKQFVFGSVEYLFATTYEASDEMSISALLAYLNAAMPQDKHEDFDTSEVARAVQSMKEKGRVVFEGDILRLVD